MEAVGVGHQHVPDAQGVGGGQDKRIRRGSEPERARRAIGVHDVAELHDAWRDPARGRLIAELQQAVLRVDHVLAGRGHVEHAPIREEVGGGAVAEGQRIRVGHEELVGAAQLKSAAIGVEVDGAVQTAQRNGIRVGPQHVGQCQASGISKQVRRAVSVAQLQPRRVGVHDRAGVAADLQPS